jgi:AraC-like DNA-binding protein
LERYFLHHFKQTPSRWTRELRCRLASELVARGWSNKAVAKELHFANESHLCHEFKKFFAATPQIFAPLYGREPAPAAKPPGGCAPAPTMSLLNKKVVIRQ